MGNVAVEELADGSTTDDGGRAGAQHGLEDEVERQGLLRWLHGTCNVLRMLPSSGC